MAGIGVSNSSPLIVFQAVSALELLTGCFTGIVVPQEVKDEVRRFPNDFVSARRIMNLEVLSRLSTEVDLGEAAAIALTLETPGSTVILDDRKGRDLARRNGLNVVGSLGIIIRAKHRGVIPLARPVINELRSAGLFISDSLVRQALLDVGE